MSTYEKMAPTAADPNIRYLREGIMGTESVIRTPFGEKRRRYFDYIASGLPFAPIEDLIREHILPNMANTHTESNTSGRNMTHQVKAAYKKINRYLGADDRDVLVFAGAGSTTAINRLIHAMGLRIPPQACAICDYPDKMDSSLKPVIFRSMMEHHSNDISWRETYGITFFVDFSDDGGIDWRDLDRKLSAPEIRDRPMKIGTFSAASNVTGILTNVNELARVMHDHGGYAFFDYAAAAPYVSIDMHPNGDDRLRKDAVFISTHKFIGGPQTPGILAANRDLFSSDVPVEPGGGTVLYTSPWDHRYFGDIQTREGGGTPPIIQIIRAGLVFDLKNRIGTETLMRMEAELVAIARDRFSANKKLQILGNTEIERLGVFSLIFDGGRLHHNLAVRLLNDRFGIQVRSGCMCAGTYGHNLLGIEYDASKLIRTALDAGSMQAKPGWVRISLSPATELDDLEYMLDAVDQISEDWQDYADKYIQDSTGEWIWAGDDFEERFELLTLDGLE